MALFLEGIEGPAEGQKFLLESGVRVGRAAGEIVLPDSKVSALHAQVESTDKGQLYLVDRGSSNGLKINGQKVKKVALLPGVKVQIGRSLLRVVEELSESSSFSDLEGKDGWRKVLFTQIPQLSARNLSQATIVQRFSPLVGREFLEGIQAETKLVLGYGPRKAGFDVMDIELQDPDSPDIAFELLPESDGGVRFRTAFPEIVLLNEINVSSELLRPGDQIRVGLTLIEVKFLT